MKEVTRKEFYNSIDLSNSVDIHNDRNVSILKCKGRIYKTVHIGDFDCETSIDCKEVIYGEEDTKFFIEA